jgi:Peptidase family M23
MKTMRFFVAAPILVFVMLSSPLTIRPASASFKSGNLRYPLRYPITAQVEDGVATQGRPNHEGYDFFPGGNLGHPVFAAHSGVVSIGGANVCGGPSISGLWITVTHGTYRSNYFHLSSYSAGISAGAIVAAGQLIALEGESGDACGAHHLHWEVRDVSDGVPIDLNPWIPTAPNTCAPCAQADPWVTAFAPLAFRGTWDFTESGDSSIERSVRFGVRGDIPLMGDWDGDGYNTVGIVRFDPATGNLAWYLSNKRITATVPGEVMITSYAWNWGTRNDLPVTGDWVSSGTVPDRPGIVRRGLPPANLQWWLNTASPPFAAVFSYGESYDAPAIGDWTCTTGSGSFDTPGITRASSSSGGALRWLLSNGLPAAPSYDFTWGSFTDRALAAKWGPNGECTSPVIHRQEDATWFLNSGFDSSTEVVFGFGDNNSYGMIADWDNDIYDEFVIGT